MEIAFASQQYHPVEQRIAKYDNWAASLPQKHEFQLDIVMAFRTTLRHLAAYIHNANINTILLKFQHTIKHIEDYVENKKRTSTMWEDYSGFWNKYNFSTKLFLLQEMIQDINAGKELEPSDL